MANQTTKIIDVTRSFIPIDPNAFPNNMQFPTTDKPETAKFIVPYEGYNFMPTSYGYKSYFGITSKLDIDALTSRVDYLLILQTSQYINIAVALCEDGIWTKQANEVGAWAHAITLSIPEVGVHYDWSYCFIDNDFFAYRAGNSSYYRFSNVPRVVTPGEITGALPTVIDPETIHPANEFYAVTPNFLNLAGQIGIFKAGSRLGFWDSANSVAWSSIDDYADFVPNVLTQAGSAIFVEVQGRITNILPMADGFVIYSTKSITNIIRDDSSTMQWNPTVVLKDAGIAFKRECCLGETTIIQYAVTSIGIIKIEGTKAVTIVEEISDFLRESKEPIFLSLIEGRYLFIEILDSDYVDGLVSFTTQTIPSDVLIFPSSNIVVSPELYDEVTSIYNGTNAEMQARIDAYLAANALPARKPGTNYTALYSVLKQDSRQVRKLIDGVPTESSVVDDTLTTINVVYGYPQNAIPPNNPKLEVLQAVGSIISGTSDNRYLTPEELEGLSLDSWIYQQSYIWDSNDISDIATIQYVLNKSDDAYLHVNSRGPEEVALGASFSPPPEIVFYPQGSVPVGTYDDSLILSNYRLTNPLTAGKFPSTKIQTTLKTIDSLWSIPTASYNNATVTLSRKLLGRMQLDRIIDLTTEYQGETISIGSTTKSQTLHYALRAKVRYETILIATPESTTTQESVITIESFDYIGTDNLPYSIDWNNSFALDPIDPFYFSSQGSIVYPPVSFLMQNGSIGPVYPTIHGAIVYDTQLKKWGKMKQDYKVLVDWSPLNNLSGNIIPFEVFGVQGGIVQPDGKIALFDKYPIDSYIKYGKIGYYRQGMTSAQEIRVSFREPSTGALRSEASLDGTSVELGLTKVVEYTNKKDVILYPSTVGRWHTVSFIGIYDIKHLEFRGTIVGNR
jgi:hypothetical protein